MLAPLVESIFHHAFLKTRDYYASQSRHMTSHPRWYEAEKYKWDCHFVYKNGRISTDLIEGIFQLADAVGLTPHLPKDLRPRLTALFRYRNKMFHHGFEWPIDERDKFATLVRDERWPDAWFRAAKSNGHPWIYYMTEMFITAAVLAIEQVIEAIGCFARCSCLRK